MMRNLHPWGSLVLLTCVFAASLHAQSANLLKNGNFSEGLASWEWDKGTGDAKGEVIAQAGLDAVTVFQIVQPSEASPAQLTQKVTGLVPGAGYIFTAWVKGRNCGAGILLGGTQKVNLPSGTFDWSKVEVVFRPEMSVRETTVGFVVSGKTEELWISKVSLTSQVVQVQGKELAFEKVKRDFSRIAKIIDADKKLSGDDELKAGLIIAKRFIDRVETSGPNGTQGIKDAKPGDREVALWDQLQIQEVGTVLEEMEGRILVIKEDKLVPYQMPDLRDGKITFDSSGFWFTEEKGHKKIPVVLGGYGFFGQISTDMEFLKSIGLSIVQQERGPRDMTAEGTLTSGAKGIVSFLDKADKNGVYADVLLSPHYFPDWAAKKSPDALLDYKGFLKFKIDHPTAVEVVSQWIRAFVPSIKDSPSLMSVCLSNEASYGSSGRDSVSLAKWIAFLKIKHGAIQKLNERYGSQYKSFEEVIVPGMGYPEDAKLLPTYYDWVRFNQQNFANWHHWMYQTIKEVAPDLPAHAKLVPDVFDTRPQEKRTHGGNLSHGVDPELIAEFTDLAGCDSWSFITPEEDYSYTWVRTQIWYDLLHSFRGRPVFDSELHYIHDRHPAERIPPGHIYTVLWQGALHHRSAFVNWLWNEPSGNSSLGSVYLRPANIYAGTRATMDLNRLAPEVRAINEAPDDVAILYSMTSLFWETDYPQVTKDLYACLTQLGCKVTFVSEKQLATGKIPDVKWIILPHATHVAETTPPALAQIVKQGKISVLAIGTGNLAFDEYHQPLPAIVRFQETLEMGKGDRANMENLASVLGKTIRIPELTNVQTKKRAQGVDYRVVPYRGGQLISLVNLYHRPLVLKIQDDGEGVDLISGSNVRLDKVTLISGKPMLIQVSSKNKK